MPTDKQQIKRLLTGSSKSAWLQWRCSELAKNFDRYARELRKGNEQRNLFLLTSAFFESAPTELAFQDPLLASSDPQGVLTAHGIDPRMSEYSGNVVFLRGETSFVSESLIGQRWSHLASRDLKLDESIQGLQGDGSQLNRVPRGVWLRDAHLDMALGTKAKEVLLFPQYVEPEGVAEKGLVRRLAAKDQAYVFDGGWFPALHSSEGQKEIRAVLGLLPRQGLKDVASSSPEQDPLVVVRNGVDGSWNYFLMINSSPWTVPIACDWNLELSSIDWMSDPDRCGVSTKNGLPDEILLQPYSIAAFRVGDDRLRLVSWKVHPSPMHRSEAQRSLDLFGQRLNQTAFSGGNGLLRNGDFEEGNTNGASIEGWTTSLLPTTMLRLDDQEPLSGKRCLRLENQTSSASTWIQSTPFEPPMTGRLAVDFYARLESGSEPVQLIISISGGRANGSKLQVSREVILQPNSKRSIVDPKNPSSIAPKWVYYQVPLLQDQDASDLTELQLAFDLRGKGAMGLDRVVVHDYFLLDEERRQLRSEVFAAKRELELGNLGATRRLLDSYWSRFLNEFGPVDSKSEGVGQKTTALRASTASLSDQGIQRDTAEERTRSNAKGGNPREESKGWLQRWRENWGRNRKK